VRYRRKKVRVRYLISWWIVSARQPESKCYIIGIKENKEIICVYTYRLTQNDRAVDWFWRFTPSAPDIVGEDIMFRVVRPLRSSVCPSVRSSMQTDLFTTMSREQLEPSRWNLQWITTRPYTDDLITFWRSKVSVIAGRGEGIHVDAVASRSIFYSSGLQSCMQERCWHYTDIKDWITSE